MLFTEMKVRKRYSAFKAWHDRDGPDKMLFSGVDGGRIHPRVLLRRPAQKLVHLD